MTVRVYSDQAGTTAAAANDNIGKVEDLSKFDSDGVSSTTGPYLSVDANGFGSADILAQGGDVVQTFTNAIADGSALVVGTSKCIFFSNVNVEAGGTLTIGPAGDMINTNGLNLIGKVVSVATTTKVLTTAEQNSIATFFAARGASSVIVNDETVYDVNSVEADVVLDFTGDSFYRNVPHYFKLGGTYTTFADAFTGTSPKLTYSTTSNSTMVNSAGELVWAPHNLVTYSEDFSQWADHVGLTLDSSTTTDPLGGSTAYTYSGFSGAANNRLSQIFSLAVGVSSTLAIWLKGTAGETIELELDTNGAPENTITFTGDWQLETISNSNPTTGRVRVIYRTGNTADVVSVWGAHVYRSDLGGMAQVPGAATGFEYYVPTSGNAEYLPRVGHHVYNGSTWVNEGLLIESESRTNLLLNSSTLSTQSVTVTAAAHTLSFTGTGTITLSGVSTDGPLVGTGTGEGNRVSLTFTPTAGSLTLTVSGTVSNAQLELGSTPSSYMPTSGGTYTRTAQSLEVPPAEFGWNSGAVSIQMDGRMTYADEDTGEQVNLLNWNTGTEWVRVLLSTSSTTTGTIDANQREGGVTYRPVNIDTYSPGVLVPFNISSRHGSTFINGAADGVALAANTTPTALPDLSGTNLEIAPDFMGTIGQFRQFAGDIGDAGLVTATKPSTEPTLSLTFDGTNGSFYNLNWSE